MTMWYRRLPACVNICQVIIQIRSSLDTQCIAEHHWQGETTSCGLHRLAELLHLCMLCKRAAILGCLSPSSCVFCQHHAPQLRQACSSSLFKAFQAPDRISRALMMEQPLTWVCLPEPGQCTRRRDRKLLWAINSYKRSESEPSDRHVILSSEVCPKLKAHFNMKLWRKKYTIHRPAGRSQGGVWWVGRPTPFGSMSTFPAIKFSAY